jgi:hypothetical protein
LPTGLLNTAIICLAIALPLIMTLFLVILVKILDFLKIIEIQMERLGRDLST